MTGREYLVAGLLIVVILLACLYYVLFLGAARAAERMRRVECRFNTL
jgi:hypothetical protein